MDDDQHDEPGPHDGRPVVLTVVGPVVRSEVAWLCWRAWSRLAHVGSGRTVACDVTALGTPDAVALDALARVQLLARRCGHHVELQGASPLLRAVLVRAGLHEALPVAPSSVVEAQRQAEEREQPFDVEEGRQRHDPTT